MKTVKIAGIAALAALAMGSAKAETIYISGSTACRTVIQKGIYDLGYRAQAWSDTATKLSLPYVNSKDAVWTNGTHTLVCSFQGSELGIQSAASSGTKTIAFVPGTSTSLVTSADRTVTTGAHICCADNAQGASRFYQKRAGDNYNYASVSDNPCVVLSFDWVGSKNIPFTNVTTASLQWLFKNGSSVETLFDGKTDANSETTFIYAQGRDIDSGTRLQALANVGIGYKDAIIQYQVNSSSSIQKYPTNSIDGIFEDLGNGGLSGGDLVCATMTNVFAANLTVDGTANGAYGNYLIGYAGTSDANGQTANGLVKMSFNGVFSSTNAIACGQYSFWGYEYIGYAPNATAAAKSLVSSLITKIKTYGTSTITPNVAISEMLVDRNGEGGTIYNTVY